MTRPGRIIVTDQLAALVVVGKSLTAHTVNHTFCARGLANGRLLKHRQGPQLIVILPTAPRAPTVPTLHRRTGLAQQIDPPTGIDAAGTQFNTGQPVEGAQIGRGRSILKQPWIPLGNRPTRRVEDCAVDPRLGDEFAGILPPVGNLAHR
ncbi:hypothetical protein D3C78_1305580 [compost metagenome]